MKFITAPFELLIKYHYLIYILAQKELKIRYRGSFFGFLWSMLNPLLNLIIYTFLFVIIFKNTAKAYPVYFFCGILPWNWFASSIMESSMAIVGAVSFVKSSTLPSEINVITKVLANGFNYILSLPVLFLFLIFFHIPIGINLIYLPIIILIEFFITCGIAFFPACWNVFFRDTQYIVQNIMQLAFFVVPVMYFDTQLPLKLRKLIYLNPLAYLIKCYHDIFYDNIPPRPELIIALLIISIVIYVLGFWYFNSKKEVFADYL